MKQQFLQHALQLFAVAFIVASCNTDDDQRIEKPEGYDIYVTGYKTDNSKATGVVWKNGVELYPLADEGGNTWGHSICVVNRKVYVAGYEETATGTRAKIWEDGALKYTLSINGINSYAYVILVANGSIYAAGYEETDGNPIAKIWRDGAALYTGATTDISSNIKALALSGRELYAAGTLRTRLEEPIGFVLRGDKILYSLGDTKHAAAANGLLVAGRTTYAVGNEEKRAVVWRDGKLLYNLTDGTIYSEATATWGFAGALYTAGYEMDGSLTSGMVWRNGKELFDLTDAEADGAIPHSIAVYFQHDIFTAGTLFTGSTRRAAVWHNDEIECRLGPENSNSEAYSMSVVPHYD